MADLDDVTRALEDLCEVVARLGMNPSDNERKSLVNRAYGIKTFLDSKRNDQGEHRG
jgi:F0F1-type ATP synthase beta subunit